MLTTSKATDVFLEMKPILDKYRKQLIDTIQTRLDDAKIKYLSQSRTKALNSINEKLQKLKKTNFFEFQDLIGIRIITYLPEDTVKTKYEIMNLFSRECIIDDYPKYEQSGYEAQHIVIKLNRDKLNGLKFELSDSDIDFLENISFEIQFTTLLDHAFNEISHDIFYKAKTVSDYNKTEVKKLEAEFIKIKNDKLKEAEFDLAKILNECKKLEYRTRLHSKENLDTLLSTSSDFVIYRNLKELNTNFDYKLLKESGIKPLEISLRAKAHIQTDMTLAEFLRYISIVFFLDTEANLDIIFDIYNASLGKQVWSDKITRFLENICKYKIENDTIYYGLYLEIINYLEKKDVDYLINNIVLVKKILHELLSFDFDGGRWKTGREYELRYGSLPPHSSLKLIRSKCIGLLFKLIENSGVKLRDQFLQVLEAVFHPGMSRNEFSQEFINLMGQEMETVLSYCLEKYHSWELEELVMLECLIHRVETWLPFFADNRTLKNLSYKLECDKNFKRFRDRFRYRTTKTDAWINKDKNIRLLADSEIESIGSKVDLRRLMKEILLFIKNYDFADFGRYWQYQYAFQICFELGLKKPELAYDLLGESAIPEPLKLEIICGIWLSNQNTLILALVKEWAKNDPERVLKVFDRTRKLDFNIYKDLSKNESLHGKLFKVLLLSTDVDRALLEPQFNQIVETYNSTGVQLPFDQVYFSPQTDSFISQLSFNTKQKLIDNLLIQDIRGYHIQHVIFIILKNGSLDILTYLLNGILNKVELNLHSSYFSGFEDTSLRDYLQSEWVTIFKQLFDKYVKSDDHRVNHFICDFLTSIQPQIDEQTNQMFLNFIDSGADVSYISKFLDYLRFYNGDASLDFIIQEIIKKGLSENNKFNSCLLSIVKGFGGAGVDLFLKRYTSIRDRVESWPGSNRKIKHFKNQFKKNINRLIKIESIRVRDENAMLARL